MPIQISKKLIAAALGVCASFASFHIFGQVTSGQEYHKKVDVARTMAPLDEGLFGDELDGYTGAVEFAVTDVSIPGNNKLEVAFRRRFKTQSRLEFFDAGRFGLLGDWNVDVPYLHGEFLYSSSTPGKWSSMQGSTRCAIGQAKDAQPFPLSTGKNFQNRLAYWHGNFLHVPGRGSSRLLHSVGVAADKPSDGRAYYWTTEGRWHLSCLPSTANGVGGDAFLAVSPEGMKYWFDQLALHVAAPVFADGQILSRNEVRMMPTRVEDQFGNWVVYKYSPDNHQRVIEVNSSDGRRLLIHYNATGRISEVWHGNRVWRYHYDADGRLIEAVRPDGTKWTYSPPWVGKKLTVYGGACGGPGKYTLETGVMAVTHPSGAAGRFYMDVTYSGRTYVPQKCWTTWNDENWVSGSYDLISPHSVTLSLTRKEIVGAGISAPMVWTWDRPLVGWKYEHQCQQTACPEEKTVSVTRPDGTVEQQTYGIRFDRNEGLLLRTDIFKSDRASKASATAMEYLLDPTGQAFPAKLGNPIFFVGTTARDRPLWRRITKEDGNSYLWQVTDQNGVFAFDRHARPLKSASVGSGSETINLATPPAPTVAALPAEGFPGTHLLDWGDGPSAHYYIVEQNVSGQGWVQVYMGQASEWAASLLGPNTYEFRITACSAGGSCRQGQTFAMKVKPADITPIILELLLN